MPQAIVWMGTAVTVLVPVRVRVVRMPIRGGVTERVPMSRRAMTREAIVPTRALHLVARMVLVMDPVVAGPTVLERFARTTVAMETTNSLILIVITGLVFSLMPSVAETTFAKTVNVETHAVTTAIVQAQPVAPMVPVL